MSVRSLLILAPAAAPAALCHTLDIITTYLCMFYYLHIHSYTQDHICDSLIRTCIHTLISLYMLHLNGENYPNIA